MIERMRKALRGIVREEGIFDGPVEVIARVLTPGEAIGNPEHDDYPILDGRERLMEATFGNGRGVAFTDMFGNWSGTLGEILDRPAGNNFRRAIFVATANALLHHLGKIGKTSHCKDTGPVDCAKTVCGFIVDFAVRKGLAAKPKIFQVGFQPRLFEALAGKYEVRITDLDAANVGKIRCGVEILDGSRWQECIEWCDMIFATGTTLVNDTAGPLFDSGKPAALYGVTCAAAAHLFDIERYCPEGF